MKLSNVSVRKKAGVVLVGAERGDDNFSQSV